MKIMKRLFCLSIAILLLCASLTACAPQQEEISELDLIKAEWQRVVIDKAVEIPSIQVLGFGFESNLGVIEDQGVIDEILSIFETLNISDMRLWEEAPSQKRMFLTPLNVIMTPKGNNTSDIRVHLKDNGEAYIYFEIDGKDHWICTSDWFVYEEIKEYK